MPNASQILQDRLSENEPFIARLAQALARRATALMNPPAGPLTANTTAASKVLTSVSSLAGVEPGYEAEISSVPDQPATVTAVDVGASTVTLSEAAQANNTGAALVIKRTPAASDQAICAAVRDNVETYARKWSRFYSGHANIIGTITVDPDTGEPLTSATDLTIEAMVNATFPKAFA